ncbi:MAG: thioredoxin family protein [Phycisphaerales bacterium]|nr:thioredoxin family protein [Phycisphaerales bacterium]
MKWSTVLIILVFVGYLAFMMLRKPAPTPGVFDAQITLADAQIQSAQSGKPIFVLVTADWCAPCQTLKRGALLDPSVVELISTQTIPVYLEADTNGAEIQNLPVSSYPTALVIKDGEVSASIVGGKPARKYLAVLKKALATGG